jgi:hypothetical protein
MPASKNSANSQASSFSGAAKVFVALTAFASLAAWVAWSRDYTFYYGDAEAHLNIARRIFDSRTPNGEQIGTVWLPLTHLLITPFARVDSLWINGLAGVIPSVLCFAFAGTFLYLATRTVAAPLLFATNASMLYLASIPMAESVMAAAFAALLWATFRYRDGQSTWALLVVAAISNAASLTRYEGWFLIPFVALYIWICGSRRHAILFAILASLAPIAWLAHNQFYYGDPLAFYRGPYSAQAILERQQLQNPAAHDWQLAAKYYAIAVRDVLGTPLLVIAGVGMLVALFRRAFWPLALLLLPGIFYVLSIHSGGTPVFIRELPPYTLYNTRYALALLPLAAYCGAALLDVLPWRIRTVCAFLIAIAIGLLQYRVPVSLCWEEARTASESRRAWTSEAAAFLKSNYQPGSGIVFWFGDIPGVFRQAGIPFREGLYQDNGESWLAAMSQPAEFQRNAWAIAIEGDPVDQAVRKQGNAYRIARRIEEQGAPAVTIYRRQ